MGWANVQALAFLKQSGRPAPGVPSGARALGAAGADGLGLDDAAGRGPNASGWRRSRDATEQADGCTGLHFLDGSIFEECCTRHDLCYERDAPGDCCEAWSWLVPNPFWHCARCNFAAVWCFLTRPQPDPDWLDEGPLGECERQSYRDWCAPECATCRTREDTGGTDTARRHRSGYVRVLRPRARAALTQASPSQCGPEARRSEGRRAMSESCRGPVP